MATKFLREFFLAHRTKQLVREIQQKYGDLFYEAWKDFKSWLNRCPTHNLHKDDVVLHFYEGLNEINRMKVDSACNGVLMRKNSEEAMELFEELSEDSQ